MFLRCCYRLGPFLKLYTCKFVMGINTILERYNTIPQVRVGTLIFDTFSLDNYFISIVENF